MRRVLVIATFTLAAGLPAGAATQDVLIRGFAFAPTVAGIAVGDSVTWRNLDDAPHTATSSAGAPIAFDSGTLTNGQTFTMTFPTPGTYDYFCRIHPFMVARLNVAAPPSAGLELAPEHVDFGALQPGAVEEATVTVTNVSGGSASVSAVGASGGPFAVSSHTCAGSLGAGATCAVTVSFAPTVEGEWDGTLTLTSDVGTGSHTARLHGIGDATGPVVRFSRDDVVVHVRALGKLAGTATDDRAGVGALTLEFEDPTGDVEVIWPSESCTDSTRRSCTWDAFGPGPGVYQARAWGFDRAGNRSATHTVTLLVI